MRLIDADMLKYHYSWWGDNNSNKELFDNIIDAQPTVDAEIVKYGKWIESERHGYKCSNCNCMSSFWDDNLKSPYCPWCGAKMDLE